MFVCYLLTSMLHNRDVLAAKQFNLFREGIRGATHIITHLFNCWIGSDYIINKKSIITCFYIKGMLISQRRVNGSYRGLFTSKKSRRAIRILIFKA